MPAVKYRLDGNVAVLEIDNPPVNATSISVREGLAEALKEAGADPAVDALVLTGSNGVFLAGADIKEISSGLSNKFPMLRDLQSQMEALPKPIVAAIQGVALGGGFEIALTCHWRVAAKSAQISSACRLRPFSAASSSVTRMCSPRLSVCASARKPAAAIM